MSGCALDNTFGSELAQGANPSAPFSIGNPSLLFYPYYGPDGRSVECRNDENIPEWITKTMLKSTRSECCSSYFMSQQFNDCHGSNALYPYYPNFKRQSCDNDGSHPKWMSGDYLFDQKWLCCQSFFAKNDNMLRKCTG